MKLSELARLTGANVDGAFNDVEITGAAGLDDAGPTDVSFLANPRYTAKVNTTRAALVSSRTNLCGPDSRIGGDRFINHRSGNSAGWRRRRDWTIVSDRRRR